ncbi:LAQU0S07e05204g1_1 [Lachancea quebecensis]|uniref:LAQU0S07e05204g1_1 n=1 Tax=Lachancea quebecensis TaxID=1654605 RepID=A0A0P1KZR1_9SACH|nr:LAQU0S07e05204g1_1 [Lachancea quebecensis]
MSLLRTVRSFGQSQTEIKTKDATNDDEYSGATGSLMNEISVLTYSPRTLREISAVIRKRLSGNNRKSSHKNAVHILKTLTLTAYLINNGSNEFVAWIRSYVYLIDSLKEFTIGSRGQERMAKQIRSLASTLSVILRDDELLRQRRSDVTLFRSSISTPGRKSTDNSHLRLTPLSNRADDLRNTRPTRSLDVGSRPYPRHSSDRARARVALDPLDEEEALDKENMCTSVRSEQKLHEEGLFKRRGVTRLASNNPFR